MVKKENYITIQGWMTDLGLSGNKLLVFAIIYGFSQDEQSVFSGSSTYIADWLKIDKRNVLAILKYLTENDFIIKIEKTINGVKLCDYKTSPVVIKHHQGSDETSLGGGDETSSHNNNIYNNIYNKKNIYKKPNENDEEIVNGWNNIAKKWQLPTISLLTDKRKTKLYNLLKKYKYTLEDFYSILEDRIKKSLFLQGVVQKRDGSGGYIFEHSAKWHCDFDFFLQESSFVKTVDNAYTDGDFLK